MDILDDFILPIHEELIQYSLKALALEIPVANTSEYEFQEYLMHALNNYQNLTLVINKTITPDEYVQLSEVDVNNRGEKIDDFVEQTEFPCSILYL